MISSETEGAAMTVLAAALALVSALLFAGAAVAQRMVAGAVPDGSARGVRLLGRLLRSPRWWVGTFGDTAGFVVQAAALGVGSLLLVQPLLVTTVLFALPLEAWTRGRRVERSEIIWAVLLVAALAVFVVVGEPTAGRDRAPFATWVPAGAVLLGVLVVCVAGGGRRRGPRRAALLATGTGLVYGLVAALTVSVVSLLGGGLLVLVSGWETGALVVAVLGGSWLQQVAFGAGPLRASLPAATVAEPAVGALLGVVVLGERVRADGAEWALIAVLIAVMVVATTALARSGVSPPIADASVVTP